ncbi:hypothetical protein TIFTF001_001452 [Ficus carica]|uniref:Uncharacterized protein n=1 Tax=Ficus carica TaxID=3494 RepID=A0AA87Z027_FICCA|nr:hypothetical protein TIFTF001_001452 [Ficus carica]
MAEYDAVDEIAREFAAIRKELDNYVDIWYNAKDAKKRKLLRSDVVICPGCNKLVALATSFIEFSKKIFDEDIDDGGEAAYQDDEEFGYDLLVHEELVDDLLVHEDPVDENHTAEEPYTWAVFSELITEETGVGRNCECPRHSEDENGIIKYYVPLDKLKFWDGAEEKSARKALKKKP